MNLNKRFKKLASLITCGAICAVMLFWGTSPAFSHLIKVQKSVLPNTGSLAAMASLGVSRVLPP